MAEPRQDPKRRFAVRAVTRDALSKASRALADLGAEVVQCNIADKEQVKPLGCGLVGDSVTLSRLTVGPIFLI